MAEIHLICGFIGFGKTTYAKRLEHELQAIRFTHDEIMVERYGRLPDDFACKYKLVDDFIKEETAKLVSNGKSVILDYGFWSRDVRRNYYEWAKKLTDKVYFHSIVCDLDVAKQRVLKRNQENKGELFIDEDCFNTLLSKYEPLSDDERYPIILYHQN